LIGCTWDLGTLGNRGGELAAAQPYALGRSCGLERWSCNLGIYAGQCGPAAERSSHVSRVATYQVDSDVTGSLGLTTITDSANGSPRADLGHRICEPAGSGLHGSTPRYDNSAGRAGQVGPRSAGPIGPSQPRRPADLSSECGGDESPGRPRSAGELYQPGLTISARPAAAERGRPGTHLAVIRPAQME
jgi:hypothetical protein